jgi:hypothetical protein
MICKFLSEPSYSLYIYEVISESYKDPLITTHPEFYKKTTYKEPDPESPPSVRMILHDRNKNVYTLAKNYKEYSFQARASEVLLADGYQLYDKFNIYQCAPFINYPHLLTFHDVCYTEGDREINCLSLECCTDLDLDQHGTADINLPYTSLLSQLNIYYRTSYYDDIGENEEIEKANRIQLGCSICAYDDKTVVFYGGFYDENYNNKILVLKKQPGLEFYKYVVKNVKGMLPTPRAHAAICRYTDGFLIHGGKFENALSCMFSLCMEKDEEKEGRLKAKIEHLVLANSPKRYSHELVECQGKFYILGGAAERKDDENKIYSFNIRDLACQEVIYKGARFHHTYKEDHRLTVVVKGHLIFVSYPSCNNTTPANNHENLWVFNTRTMYANTFPIEFQSKSCFLYDFPGPYVMIFKDFRNSNIKRLITGPVYNCQLPPINQNSIQDFLSFLYTSQYKSDIKITTSNGEICCHSLILGMRKRDGRYLASLINQSREIRLNNENADIVRVILKYLYTDQLDNPERVVLSQHVKVGKMIYVTVYEYISDLLDFAKRYRMGDLIAWLNLIIGFDGEFVKNNKLYLLNELKDLLNFSISHGDLELKKQISSDSEHEFQNMAPDMFIQTNKRMIGVNKLFLSMRSEFFRGYFLFTNEDMISLEEYSEDAILCMLRYVYYDHFDIPHHLLYEMMQLSRHLSIHGLLLEVEAKLCYSITPKNLAEIAEMAWIHNAENLIIFITDFVKNFATTEKMKSQLMELKNRCPEFGYRLIEIYIEAKQMPVYILPTNTSDLGEVPNYLRNNPIPRITDPLPKGFEARFSNTELESCIRDINSYRDVHPIAQKQDMGQDLNRQQEESESEELNIRKGNRFLLLSSQESEEEEYS